MAELPKDEPMVKLGFFVLKNMGCVPVNSLKERSGKMRNFTFVSLSVILALFFAILLYVPSAAEETAREDELKKELEELRSTFENQPAIQPFIEAIIVEFNELSTLEQKSRDIKIHSIETLIGTLKEQSKTLEEPLKTKVQTKLAEIKKFLTRMQEESSEAKLAKNINEGVDTAIKLRDNGYSDSSIAEIIANRPEFAFGSAKLTKDQMTKLKKSFEEDFIENWVGVKQRITVGAAGVFLTDADELVAAAIIRILTPPRSFHAKLNLWPWSRIKQKPHKRNTLKLLRYNIDPDHFDAWINRFDLNVGVTTATSTDDVESGNFILAGFSYEINRAAFLNFGLAVSTAGNVEDTDQWYVGITLDQNILKILGVTK
jgi:hypothetical protein